MEKIVITSKSRQVKNDLDRLQAKASQSLSEIQGLADIPCESIDTLTGEYIASYVGQKVAEVGRSNFLTSQAKTDLVEQWQKMGKTASKCAKDITAFVEACKPVATVTLVDGELTTDKSLQDIADTLSLAEIPEGAKKHISLIKAVRKSIADLREFEKVEDLKPMTMNTVSTIQDDEICQSRASGWTKRDHSFDHLYERAARRREYGITIGRVESITT